MLINLASAQVNRRTSHHCVPLGPSFVGSNTYLHVLARARVYRDVRECIPVAYVEPIDMIQQELSTCVTYLSTPFRWLLRTAMHINDIFLNANLTCTSPRPGRHRVCNGNLSV